MPRFSLLFTPVPRIAIALGALAAVLSTSPSAKAECPPGSWFCADAIPDESAEEDDKPAEKKSIKAEEKEKKDEPVVKQTEPDKSSQPPAGTTVIVQTAPPAAAPPPAAPPPAAPPPDEVRILPPPRMQPIAPRKYSPPPKRQRLRSEWGFNMRLQSALMEDDKRPAQEGAGMGGLGFSLRLRPVGHFALDFGLDFVGGKDFNGARRSEVPFSINTILFINPKDRAQLYFLGGLGWSSARVERADNNIGKYSYFGFQTGIGLEYRATRTLGLNVDLIGFLRGRTDSLAKYEPEFVDEATGRTTNTSGGGLFRAGLTLYW